MAAHTKVQLKTLSVLRSILRHIRQDVDTIPLGAAASGAPVKRDVSEFTNHIMGEYRASQKLTDRTKAKQLRAYAGDTLAYLNALRDQRRLIADYRGVDPDKPAQRDAAARFVGLQVPDSAPVGRDPLEVASKYSSSLAKAVDAARFSGVDNMKAQYYGAASVIAEKGIGKELTEVLQQQQQQQQQAKGTSGGSSGDPKTSSS